MPVEHMVWIRFHDNVPAERVQRHLAALAALPETVPAIQRLVVGENFTDRSGGFTHGLLVTVEDRKALDAYRLHPDHARVAQALSEDAELRALDIEG